MKSSVKVVPLERAKVGLLAVTVSKLNGKVPHALLGLDAALEGGIERLIASGDFKGGRDEVAVLYPPHGAQRVVLVGLGEPADATRDALRRAASIAARKAVGFGVETLGFAVAHETHGHVPPEAVGQLLIEGAGQGAWEFRQLKATDPGKGPLKAVELIVAREESAAVERGRKIGAAIAVGQKLARNLQMLPGNVCTPSYLGQVARELGRAYRFKVTVLNKAQIEKQEMYALLAVAQGSVEEPRFIILEYKGAGRAAPICFVGKGVTFDSGGISIKPAQSMEEMKYDMSGAAAVLGLFEVLGQLKPKVNVVGVVPTTENLPSGSAIKPGDVVRGQLGKTIEIVNTDAEGRLILVDALSYVRRFKPACVIDAATLTGAIVIALGNYATGLMGNDDALLSEVQRAGDTAGEPCWPLPLWDEYREQIKSDIADVKNTGGRPAGSITAGWFLREFVDGFPWAHLDIAGTAWTDAERPYLVRGPTGVGVRLFSELVLARAGG